MRQIAITIIALLALTIGVASCSHESPVPFLEDMGVNTDSLLVDSFPNPLFDEDLRVCVSLDSAQCEALGLCCYSAKIVSTKQFKNNYLLTFFVPYRGLLSILYDKKGKALDECLQVEGLGYRSKEHLDSINKGYLKKPKVEVSRGYRSSKTEKVDYFNWERHYVDSDKFEVVGTHQNTDTIIKYLYKVANNKITQISRSTTKNIKTVYFDIISLPISQTYQACDIMSRNPIIFPKGVEVCGLGAGTYTREMELFALYNTPAILKWILDHRGKDDTIKVPVHQNIVIRAMYVIRARRELDAMNEDKSRFKSYNKKNIPPDLLKKQILQIKDKEAQQYLIKELGVH